MYLPELPRTATGKLQRARFATRAGLPTLSRHTSVLDALFESCHRPNTDDHGPDDALSAPSAATQPVVLDLEELRQAVLGLGLGVHDARPMRRNLKHGHAVVVFVIPSSVDAQAVRQALVGLVHGCVS